MYIKGIYTAQEMQFSIKDLVTYAEEILNGKLHFLCSVKGSLDLIPKQETADLLTAETAETADLVTFAEEVLNGKLHFLCSVKGSLDLIPTVSIIYPINSIFVFNQISSLLMSKHVMPFHLKM